MTRRCAIAGSAALTVLVAAAVVALRRPPKRTRFPYGIPRQKIQ